MLSFCSFTLIVGLIWSITSRLLCWYRRCVLWPLPVLSGIASVFCLIGLVVFGVKSNEAADLLTSIMLSGSGQMSVTNSVGYSMVLGILATIAMTAASVFALRLTIASNNVNPI